MNDASPDRLPDDLLAEHWFNLRRRIHESLVEVYRRKAVEEGLTQDRIAARLGVDKSLVSRRLRGVENMTLRSLSDLARAMDCRIVADVEDLAQVRRSNRPPARALRDE